MDQILKQRLVGAAVLIACGVIFIPMLLDESALEETLDQSDLTTSAQNDDFNSRIIPLDKAVLDTARKAAEQDLNAEVSAAPPVVEQAEASEPALAERAEAPEPAPVERAEPQEGVNAWIVQLGSFASKDNAAAVEVRAREAGYSAYVEMVTTGGGIVYRVRVGPELLRSNAEAIRDNLEEEIKLSGMVLQYP